MPASAYRPRFSEILGDLVVQPRSTGIDHYHRTPIWGPKSRASINCFRFSEMVLNVYSDASYLTASRARSRAGGYFFLGSLPKKGKQIKLN